MNHHWFIYWNGARAQPRIWCSCGTTDLAGLAAWRRHERDSRVCAVCEDGLTLEADGTCDLCGRVGACPDCRENDCRHLRAPGVRAILTGTSRAQVDAPVQAPLF